MTDEPTAPEATRLNPGEKWRVDATFDLTLKLAWAVLRDEETRRIDSAHDWRDPGTITNDQMRAAGLRAGGSGGGDGIPLRPTYLALYDENAPGHSYLRYDGRHTNTPVNQVPDVRKWEPHLCLMAHDVDQFNIDTAEMRRPDSYATVPSGTHSAETQIRNQNTMQLFRATIGDALRRLDRWAALDPAKGGSGVFSEDWKEQREGIRAIIEDKVCQACEHKFSAREFARLHDYSAFRTILDHRRVLDEVTGSVIMRVPTIVRDAEPWTPHATENLTFFGGNDVEQGWRTAIEWYDEAVHRYDRLYADRYTIA